jgi:hypothetical protein
MQVGDLIRNNRENYVAIVLFVGEEAMEIYRPSSQSRVWLNNFIYRTDLEVLCKSET